MPRVRADGSWCAQCLIRPTLRQQERPELHRKIPPANPAHGCTFRKNFACGRSDAEDLRNHQELKGICAGKPFWERGVIILFAEAGRGLFDRILSAAPQVPLDAHAVVGADPANRQRELEVQRRLIIAQKGLDRMPLRPPDEELQKFVQQVAARCQTPIALMTLAVDDRLVFPARYGIDATEIDRYSSLCGKVIEAGEPLFVPDATLNPAFHGNALVQAGVIRGYASAPVCVARGLAVGTLCLINSSEAMRLGAEQVRSLRSAAVSLGSLLDEKQGDEGRTGLAAAARPSSR